MDRSERDHNATAEPQPRPSDRAGLAVDCEQVPEGANRYVATVDRIVDGEHVVLLLEADGRVVDQLVVSRSEFDTIEEGDILVVIVDDDELLAYRILPERPPELTDRHACP
nr:hypothetical protein [Halopiger djelfimassiliensis]